MDCKGCEEEMKECYKYQQEGYNAGFTWLGRHCFLFVLTDDDEYIVE